MEREELPYVMWQNEATQKLKFRPQSFEDKLIYITNNEMETPKKMKFIYGMFQAKVGTYHPKGDKLQTAVDNIDELSNFDPSHIYTVNQAEGTITKEIRLKQILEGKLAELEDKFLNDPSIKNRHEIRNLLDDIKHGFEVKIKSKRVAQLINNSQTTLQL